MTGSNIATSTLVYVGTYTPIPARPSDAPTGIYTYVLDADTGALQPLGGASGLKNPSFLTVDPQRRWLYAVEEVDEGELGGVACAFSIDAHTGALSPISQQRTHGANPCFASRDHTGTWLFVANYSGGNVCALPIEANGGLGAATAVIQHHGSSVNPDRQGEPHAHSIQPDPANQFVLAADLGIDQILVYQLDAESGLSAQSQPAPLHAGAGPRHLAFHPHLPVVYCMNELDSTVTVFAYANGALQTLQSVSALPDDFSGENTGADIHVDPAGRYVYSSNRGHDSIAVFAIDPTSGQLTPAGHTATGGCTPRNFAIDPTGTWLLAANQDTNTIVTFKIDRETGGLTQAGPITDVHKPVCVCISPPSA